MQQEWGRKREGHAWGGKKGHLGKKRRGRRKDVAFSLSDSDSDVSLDDIAM